MSKRTSYSGRATAFHEAGHAVQAYRDDGRVIRVTAIADSDSAGHTRVRFGKEVSTAGFVRPQVASCWGRMFLAGAIAERKQGRVVRAASRGDRLAALGWAEKISESDEEGRAWLQLWQAQAETTITRDWALVEAVAHALLERGVLPGTAFLEVVDQAKAAALQSLLAGRAEASKLLATPAGS